MLRAMCVGHAAAMRRNAARGVLRALIAASVITIALSPVGCSSPAYEAANVRLERSRLVFLTPESYDIFRPPLFGSPGEYDGHVRGVSDAYERRFRRAFPAAQEQWFARFQPLPTLSDALRRSAAPDGDAGITYYLVPLEGVSPDVVGNAEQIVKDAGFACVANQPGDATQLPMPPRGAVMASGPGGATSAPPRRDGPR